MWTRLEPKAEVRATRWASPPLSVRKRAVEAQIAQADSLQISEPAVRLLENSRGHLALPGRQFKCPEKADGAALIFI